MLLLGQDVLREKESYIDRLLKERELEQTENARISAKHVHDTDRRIKELREEYEAVSLAFIATLAGLSLQSVCLLSRAIILIVPSSLFLSCMLCAKKY